MIQQSLSRMAQDRQGEVLRALPFVALSEPWRGECWETGHLLTPTAGLSYPELLTCASLSVLPPHPSVYVTED